MERGEMGNNQESQSDENTGSKFWNYAAAVAGVAIIAGVGLYKVYKK
jgi:hypothetical protein